MKRYLVLFKCRGELYQMVMLGQGSGEDSKTSWRAFLSAAMRAPVEVVAAEEE